MSSLSRPPEYGIVLATIARLLLRLFGWRAARQVPNLPKFVIIGAPHTSNWDGLILILMAFALRVRLHWLGKHTLFKPPFGGLLKALGGIPIDRAASRNAVEQAVEWFNGRNRAVLVIAPEGTRSRADRWKTGFYHIAQGANVPLVLGFIDYSRKTAGLGPVIDPTGDLDADMQTIRAFYTGITGRHEERMSDITLG
ncbi:MAG: lysophospholipid acyltransferase family protein [Chloroflexi bacterium]|nr:lysophospholipid acyltransferase family protein [Chloroflexota bacterium]